MSSFLNNVVKHNTEEVELKLRYKPVMLEGLNTGKPNKKPKKKEMSARNKRIHGIYNISATNQRLVKHNSLDFIQYYYAIFCESGFQV